MFVKFRQCKTKEEQVNSMELAEHANNVMNTLDEGIKGLDDLDNFFQFIHQIGASHRRIPGFKVEYFWVGIHIFVQTSFVGIRRIRLPGKQSFDLEGTL